MEVLALEHLRDRVLGCQADEVVGGEFREPAAVEIDDGLLRIENLEHLGFVGFSVLLNLLA